MTKKVTKIVAFTAGLVLVSVVVAITLKKNPKMKREAQRQVKAILDVSRETIESVQNLRDKAQGLMQVFSKQPVLTAAEQEALSIAAYEEEWDKSV